MGGVALLWLSGGESPDSPLVSNDTTARKNTSLLLGRDGRPGSPVFSIDTAGEGGFTGAQWMKAMAP